MFSNSQYQFELGNISAIDPPAHCASRAIRVLGKREDFAARNLNEISIEIFPKRIASGRGVHFGDQL